MQVSFHFCGEPSTLVVSMDGTGRELTDAELDNLARALNSPEVRQAIMAATCEPEPG